MDSTFASFQHYIQSLTLADEEKETLIRHGAELYKVQSRLDFQLRRTLKDKSIAINLLNQTIEELKARQKEVEDANEELMQHQVLVEAQAEKLSHQLHMLEKSYTELEQFSYIASHDLKSPLRTIASYAGLLKRRYVEHLDPAAIEFTDYIIKAASHMNEIIQDLLEFAGVGKEKKLEVVDINEVVGLVMLNLSAEIKETKAVIKAPPLPTILGHRTGILQLFQNLVANAIKFRGDTCPNIHIGVKPCQEHWLFTVEDNGLGLDESYQEKVFMPFQRISHLDRPGTGMGLAICKKIAKAHGGNIWFESAQGKGTTFHFTVPRMDEQNF